MQQSDGNAFGGQRALVGRVVQSLRPSCLSTAVFRDVLKTRFQAE